MCLNINALIPLTLTKFSRKVEATLTWGDEKRSLTGMSVSKNGNLCKFCGNPFSLCLKTIQISVVKEECAAGALLWDIKSIPLEKRNWRLRIFRTQNEHSFVSCLQNCLFLLAVVLSSSKEENLRLELLKRSHAREHEELLHQFMWFQTFVKRKTQISPQERKQKAR